MRHLHRRRLLEELLNMQAGLLYTTGIGLHLDMYIIGVSSPMLVSLSIAMGLL
jgi:hypothetical protein